MKHDHHSWSAAQSRERGEPGPRGGRRAHHGPFRRHEFGFAHHPGPGMGPDMSPFAGPPPMGPVPPGPIPPGGPGPWAGGPWGRRGRGGPGGSGRGRAGRGDVRSAVLLLLAEAEGPMHGYQLMQAIGERTGGAWQPSPGAVYPTISQLEDEGLVTVTAEGGRRLVTLTAAGREHVAANQSALGDPFAGFAARAGSGTGLISPLQELHAAVWQVAKAGNADQVAAAQKVLADARRSLYLILAGEPVAETAQAAAGDASVADAASPAASAAGETLPAGE